MNPIDPRIHQALDGELARESLPRELQLVVERLEAAAALLAAAPAVAALEPRVMAALRRPAPSRVRRLIRWFSVPHAVTFRVRPVWSLALAAAVALLTLVSLGEENARVLGEHEGIAQFVGRVADGGSVRVVGCRKDRRVRT